jgi:hypothetical protein
MSFFENLLQKKKTSESAVLIDIGADSIAIAYVRYEEGAPPSMLYAQRVPIEIREGEPHEQSMIRTLRTLGTACIRDGAPILARATGSGTAHIIIISVDAPWQETTVCTEHFDQEGGKPFSFTKSLVTERLEKGHSEDPEKMIVDESIIGTILNGYETNNPYGKEVHRASIIVLSSRINRAVAGGIISIIRGLFHTRNILPITGSSIRYQSIRALFPHEHDAIILDATGGSLVSVALIRKGIFVTMLQIECPEDSPEWVSFVTSELSQIAKEYPLPRTIFLLAREPKITSLETKLATANFTSLWLSDNPPKIVSILGSHLVGSIHQTTTEAPDVVLLLMAIYYQTKGKI